MNSESLSKTEIIDVFKKLKTERLNKVYFSLSLSLFSLFSLFLSLFLSLSLSLSLLCSLSPLSSLTFSLSFLSLEGIFDLHPSQFTPSTILRYRSLLFNVSSSSVLCDLCVRLIVLSLSPSLSLCSLSLSLSLSLYSHSILSLFSLNFLYLRCVYVLS
jgi:hypothetical protein